MKFIDEFPELASMATQQNAIYKYKTRHTRRASEHSLTNTYTEQSHTNPPEIYRFQSFIVLEVILIHNGWQTQCKLNGI